MRLCIAVAFLALITPASAQQKPAQSAPPGASGVIRGVTRAADTGRPLRGVEIRVDDPALSVINARFAVSDDNGRYEVRALEPGRYAVTASKTGFVTTAYGQRRADEAVRPVEVRSGSVSDGIDVSLQRGSVITARIVGRTGAGVPGLTVRPFEYSFVDGSRQLRPFFGPLGVTDDRGEARLYGLPPGEYYLAARADRFRAIPDHGHVQTLYPGTATIEDAQPVRIGRSEELSVTWPMMRMGRVRISGVILDSNGAPVSNVPMQLRFDELAAFSSSDFSTGADGSFSADDLTPGDYVVIARSLQVSHPVRAVQNVTGLVITAKKPVRLQGRVAVDGSVPPPRLTALTIRPVPPRPSLSGAPDSMSLPINADGTFDTSGRFAAGVLQLPRAITSAGWFLKSVKIDGRDAPEGAIDFDTVEGKQVEVVLTRQRGTVTGTTVDRRASPVADCTVVVFPAETAEWRPYTDRIAATRPDQHGRFEMNGLPPGRYLIAVVETLRSGDERNPVALEQLRGFATSLTLADRETRAVSLRLDR